MPTINERFLDFQIAQQIRWLRVGNAEYQKIEAILKRADAEIEALLLRTKGPYSQIRLQALKKQIDEILNDIHSRVSTSLISSVRDTVATSAEVETSAFKRLLPAGLDVTTPNIGVLVKASMIKPFNGAVLGDWINQLQQGDLDRTWKTILDGITTGETTDNIIRNVIGSADLRYKDGVREVTRRGAQALVRTAITNAANEGRQGMWEDNQDLISCIRWVSTLDSRTTPICRSRDGHVGPVVPDPNWQPPPGAPLLQPPMVRPPAHANCRSTTVAVIRSWKELGFSVSELPKGTRASMNGQVPEDMTYWDWFSKQSASIQKEVLGPGRYDLWKSGKIDVSEFVDDRGHVLTLDELKNLAG